ncbi:MAG: GNAT family N-acetyltransferase [Acetobacteraceae bacterium]|nr:GNAT family N-acetyltransferase [Acetobacteraceae bacterium]
MAEEIRIETITGAALEPLVPALAQLRIAVFRDWPYLYDGDVGYEARYVRTYLESPSAAVIVAFDGANAVGASTCLPLAEETGNVQAPFQERGWDVRRFFYFGESVLLRAYRGRGIGVAFFDAREAHARRVSDCDYSCFCAVVRPPDHPLRPADAKPLDSFWRRRGYTAYPALICHMTWKDLGEQQETEKRLTFWMKPLTGVPLP